MSSNSRIKNAKKKKLGVNTFQQPNANQTYYSRRNLRDLAIDSQIFSAWYNFHAWNRAYELHLSLASMNVIALSLIPDLLN